jgi:hypothetical protein
MGVMTGFEDLQAKRVVAWDPVTGRVTALTSGEQQLKEYELFISPNGKLMTREYVADTTTDQTPLTPEQQAERAAKRWSSIDQR